jgi:SAM-dependent methyltransferase
MDTSFSVGTGDWNRAWREQRARISTPKRDALSWDREAVSFARRSSETDYATQLLSIVRPRPHWTVLDMGCGSGVIAIPLARRVRTVTAVDFSPRMLSIVDQRCEAEGIDNVITVEGRWEDDWRKLGIASSYDLALASRSMVVDDLRASILALDSIAQKRVCIVTIIGDGPYDRRLFDAIGKPLNLGPDYIYNYNMLYQMGICANVTFIEETRDRTYRNPEDAFAAMQRMFHHLSPKEEERLRAYLDKHLIQRNGYWRLSYRKVVKWAVIWWDKQT